jgi:threonine synthase
MSDPKEPPGAPSTGTTEPRAQSGAPRNGASHATSTPPNGTPTNGTSNPASGGGENGESELIVDAAVPAADLAQLTFDAERLIAADPVRDLDERLEAYENIVDSEIGDTMLARARNLEREVGKRQLYLKFEGGNTTGTQKDRIAFAQAMDALRLGYDSITTATCGNYGVALALAAKCASLKCIVYMPASYRSPRVGEMESLGARIERVPGDYERAVDVSSAAAVETQIYDANPGGVNTGLQLKAYGHIAYEIYDDLRDAPAAVAVPVSNGTTLAGIYRGFLRLYRRGKTSRMPRFVAGSSYRKNPIVQSYLKGLATCEDLAPAAIRETETNEPLINWHSTEGQEALAAVRATNGWAAYASDRSMRRASRLLREKEGVTALPAATAGLIALLEGKPDESITNDRFVAILTGRR